MKKYKESIVRQLRALQASQRYKNVPLGTVEPRSTSEFIPFLKSGVSTAALVLSLYGTHPMYQLAEASKNLTSTGAVGRVEAVDRLFKVYKGFELEFPSKRKWQARTFRREEDWVVPEEDWEEIFTNDGLTAAGKLIKTEVIVVGKGENQKEGTMYYFPYNSLDIAGCARLICENLLDITNDPIFDVRIRTKDRQV